MLLELFIAISEVCVLFITVLEIIAFCVLLYQLHGASSQ